jgi:hypothetical protein
MGEMMVEKGGQPGAISKMSTALFECIQGDHYLQSVHQFECILAPPQSSLQQEAVIGLFRQQSSNISLPCPNRSRQK